VNIVKVIRMLAIVEIIILIVVLISMKYFESNLPAALRAYLESQNEFNGTFLDAIIVFLFLFILIVQIVATVALALLKGWAGRAFIYSTLSLVVVSFFVGPVVLHGINYGLDQLHLFISAIIVTLIVMSENGVTTIYNKAIK